MTSVSRRKQRSRWAPALSLVVLQGCGAGWHQPATGLEPSTMSPRQQVQVWRNGTPERWHGVVVTADAVTGIPFQQALSCDSCRKSVLRGGVDSLRLGNPEAGFAKSVGLAAVIVGLWALLVSGLE